MQTPYFGSYEFRGFSFQYLRHLVVPQEVLNTRMQLSNSGTINFCKEIWSGAQLNLTVCLVLSVLFFNVKNYIITIYSYNSDIYTQYFFNKMWVH